jgi:hypothetical protein
MSGLNSPWFFQQFRNSSGAALAGGKIYFYVAGSTAIPKAIYTDFALTTPVSQPLILDGSGFAPEYFMEAGLYKIVVRSATDTLVATRDNVRGTSDGGGGSVAVALQTAYIESFPEGQGLLVDDGGDIWGAGCFCWIVPAANFKTLKFLKTMFSAVAGSVDGKMSIWGENGDFTGGTAVKLYQGDLPDTSLVPVVVLDIDVTGYRFIGIAMDPGISLSGSFISQGSLSVGEITSTGFPKYFAYIGSHTHNSGFSTFPAIISDDAKYLISKWVAIGVELT